MEGCCECWQRIPFWVPIDAKVRDFGIAVWRRPLELFAHSVLVLLGCVVSVVLIGPRMCGNRTQVVIGRGGGGFLLLALVVLEGHFVYWLFGPGSQDWFGGLLIGIGIVRNIEIGSGQEDTAIGV